MAKHHYAMEQLPNELWLMVMDLLDSKSLKTFSTLSSKCRGLAEQQLFSRLKLSNQISDFETLNSLLLKHSHRVTALRYDCYLFPCKSEHSDDDELLVMPLRIQNLLVGEGVPKLRTVTVEFYPEDDFEDYESDWTTTTREHSTQATGIYLHELEETSEETVSHESVYQWRADIRDTFQTLIKNETLEHLEVLNLTPRVCSVWETNGWKVFLGRLTSFKLRLWGSTTTEYQSNTVWGYSLFIDSLQSSFFRHLTSLKHLHLIAEPGNSLGGIEGGHPTLLIRSEDLPQLEKLEIENCFNDYSVSQLIGARKDQIRIVRLINCLYIAEYGPRVEESCWGTFIRSISQTRPTALVDFEVRNNAIYLHRAELPDKWARTLFDSAEQEAEITAIRAKLTDSKRLRLFRYGYVDDKYGFVGDCEDLNLECFKAGRDQAEWDILMDLVAENRRRLLK